MENATDELRPATSEEKVRFRQQDGKKKRQCSAHIVRAYEMLFKRHPFCNRCKVDFPLTQLTLNHLFYWNEFRNVELVCWPCHTKVDFTNELPDLLDLIRTENKTNVFDPLLTVYSFSTGNPFFTLNKREFDKSKKEAYALSVYFGYPNLAPGSKHNLLIPHRLWHDVVRLEVYRITRDGQWGIIDDPNHLVNTIR